MSTGLGRSPLGRLPRSRRIRRSPEFQSLSRTGERRSSRHFVLLSARSDGDARLGLTVSRKVGNAVARNRVKRRVREWFRKDPVALGCGRDLVVIARRGAPELGQVATAAELDRLVDSL